MERETLNCLEVEQLDDLGPFKSQRFSCSNSPHLPKEILHVIRIGTGTTEIRNNPDMQAAG